MQRRELLSLAAVGLAGSAPVVAAPRRTAGTRAGRPLRLKLGCQSGPTSEAHFAYFARYGVRNICARTPVSGGRRYSTAAEVTTTRDMAARHGLSLDIAEPVLLPSSHIDRERFPAIMMADSPERDRDIAAFQEFIRSCAAAGVPCIK